jgi:hypothetical protein
MLYLPISKSWMISRSARGTYLICACAIIALIWTRIVLVAFSIVYAKRAIAAGSLAEICLAPIVIVGWISVGTLWVAMWYFWFSFHRASTLKKLLWFLTLQVVPLGTLMYFFGVYYRSSYFHRAQPAALSAQSGSC